VKVTARTHAYLDAPMTREKHADVKDAPALPRPSADEALRLPVGCEYEPVSGVVRVVGEGKSVRIEQFETARDEVIARVTFDGRAVVAERFDARPTVEGVSDRAAKKLAKAARLDLRLRLSRARLSELLGPAAFEPVLALEDRYGGLRLAGAGDGEEAETVFGAYAYRCADPLVAEKEIFATNGQRVVPIGYTPSGWYYMDASGSVYYADEVTHARPVRIAASFVKVLERLGHELPKAKSAAQIDVHGAFGDVLARSLKLKVDAALSDDAETWWIGAKAAVRQWDNIFEDHPATSLFAGDPATLLAAIDDHKSAFGSAKMTSPTPEVTDLLKQRGLAG
jgi:hypothetical protein